MKCKKKNYLLLIFCLQFLPLLSVNAASGIVPDNFPTIQAALNQAQAGDLIQVRDGVYAERIEFVRSGNANQYIRLEAFPNNRPILDGSTLNVPNGTSAMVTIRNKNYLTFAGFVIRNYRTPNNSNTISGVYIEGTSSFVNILNNRIHNIENNTTQNNGNAFGLVVYGTSATQPANNILIDNNELDNLKLGSSESLTINGNVTNFTVSNNKVHDNNNIGIDIIGFEGTAPNPSVDQARFGFVRGNTVYNIDSFGNPSYGTDRSAGGIYVDGGRDIIVEQNIVYQSNIGIELASEHGPVNGQPRRFTSNVLVRNNAFYQNTVGGLLTGGYDNQRGGTENCIVVNNTFFQNDTLSDGSGEVLIRAYSNNNTFKNNIIYATQQAVLVSNTDANNVNNILDHNLYFVSGNGDGQWIWQPVGASPFTSLETFRAATGNDVNSYFADPVFLSETDLDLHLSASSPAIDTGEFFNCTNFAEGSAPCSGRFDLDGQLRRVGDTVDIGADEFRGFPLYRRRLFPRRFSGG